MRPSGQMMVLVLAAAVIAVALAVAVPEGPVWLPVLPWGMLLLIAALDLALSIPARRLGIDVTFPERGFMGKAAPFRIALTGRRLPQIEDVRLTHDAGLSPRFTGGKGLTVDVTLRDRGAQKITALALRYASRFRLFEILPSWPLDLSITVTPDVSGVLNGAIRAQMLPLLEGARVMNLKGEGSEFHQLREYVAGMDPRSIDWKRSARVNRMIARETRVERNQQIMLCMDTGHMMAERLGALSRLDHAIHAALALTWAAGLASDNVGFYSFGPRPGTFLPPRPGRSAFPQIQATCAGLRQDSAETNHTLGLSVLNGRLKRRSLVVVFSDFADSTSAELLVENLAVMQRQHLILYVALGDARIRSLTTPRTPEMDDIALSIATMRAFQERQDVLDRLHRLGILCLDASPTTLSAALISRYIEIKSKELI